MGEVNIPAFIATALLIPIPTASSIIPHVKTAGRIAQWTT
uniref:Photosystem II protein M n=2 Tax=Selaginella TaxID=3246 RepID=C7B2E1_SELML|nr:photosystem II protein M [Selaginella moellendorffii]ACT88979.1 photosystem II protein M [Selaginella moellendorffii]ADH10433.1 photosystem II protein M [Selaginella moellendorffii]QBL07937.1 photosystem II protein M [Selaginella moellendorffii]UFP91616.1 photosystem II protein M [Selaginella erythropus]